MLLSANFCRYSGMHARARAQGRLHLAQGGRAGGRDVHASALTRARMLLYIVMADTGIVYIVMAHIVTDASECCRHESEKNLFLL